MTRIGAWSAAIAVAMASAAAAQDFEVGARAKGLGGNFSTLDDDPVAIWSNIAGIARQTSRMAIHYQTYVQYEADFNNAPTWIGEPEQGFVDPQALPSFQGFVVQLGTEDSPFAIGLAFVRPTHVKVTYDHDGSVSPIDGIIDSYDEQHFTRLRLGVATAWIWGSKAEESDLSIGAGLDIGFTKWTEVFNNNFAFTSDLVNEDTDTQFGGGFGVLYGFRSQEMRMGIGFSFSSKLDFQAQRPENIYPMWDWPLQWNFGISFEFFERRFKVLVDYQLVYWADAVHEATTVNVFPQDFEDTFTVALGMEYRFDVAEKGAMFLSPRIGFRLSDMPWADEDDLPSTGFKRLAIDTDSEILKILALGVGFGWKAEGGQIRTVDFGVEFFGDTPTLAFGYTHEF
jgi:long-subunit fatty acid transport protein